MWVKTMNSILICGGAGYISSHDVKKLVDEVLSIVVDKTYRLIMRMQLQKENGMNY